MKKNFAIATLILLAAIVHADDKPAAAKPSPFKNDQEKVSYAIGLNYGAGLKQRGVDIDTNSFLHGIADSTGNGAPLLTQQESRDILMAFQQKLHAEQEEKRAQAGDKNKKDGEAFLAANKTKPGVVTLPSGLQYKIIEDGKGAPPTEHDAVTVHYSGKLIDGTEFDNSHRRGQPFTTSVTGVIRGWTEALQLMKPGAKWQIFIPSDLAYGQPGQPPSIGPNSTLVFDVELLSVKTFAPPPMPQPITSDIIRVPSAEEIKHGAKPEIIKAEDVEKMQKK